MTAGDRPLAAKERASAPCGTSKDGRFGDSALCACVKVGKKIEISRKNLRRDGVETHPAAAESFSNERGRGEASPGGLTRCVFSVHEQRRRA